MNSLLLGSGLREGANRPGRKSELHPTNALGLQIDRKRTTSVTLGVADFVTGLGSPAGELADAAHSLEIVPDNLKAPEKRLAKSSLAWYHGSGKRGL